MKRRIYGLENEYGIIYSSQGARTSSTEKAVRYLFEELATVEGHLNASISTPDHTPNMLPLNVPVHEM